MFWVFVSNSEVDLELEDPIFQVPFVLLSNSVSLWASPIISQSSFLISKMAYMSCQTWEEKKNSVYIWHFELSADNKIFIIAMVVKRMLFHAE